MYVYIFHIFKQYTSHYWYRTFCTITLAPDTILSGYDFKIDAESEIC